MRGERRRRFVMNFHGIGEPPEGIPADEEPYWCSSAAWPSIADALAELDASGTVALELTFDDGNRSDVTAALPTLLERRLTATFFVCAGRIGTPGYLDDVDLRRLREAGMGIGSHGWAHVDLRRTSEDDLTREAVTSRHVIAEASGGPVNEFAIPFGSYDRRVLRSLRDYRTVYTSDGGSARDGWLVPRFSYVRGCQPEDITAMALRRDGAVTRLRRRGKTLAKALR